jgi:prepilin-type N-terminal cleavage/methylation domain-containing protein
MKTISPSHLPLSAVAKTKTKPQSAARAFSLIELLSAVMIVGIMAFFAMPALTRMRGDAELNLAIARCETLNGAINSLIQIRGRTQAVSIDWPAAATNDNRYLLLRPYLAYPETSITLYMPSGYSATLPSTLDPLRKATLTNTTTSSVIPY